MSGQPNVDAPLSLLLKLRERLSSPDRWCQHALEAKGANCLLGALYIENVGTLNGTFQLDEAGLGVWRQLSKAAGGDLVKFNNTKTHADVMALIDSAIAARVTA
jgi:hypothetical protein